MIPLSRALVVLHIPKLQELEETLAIVYSLSLITTVSDEIEDFMLNPTFVLLLN